MIVISTVLPGTVRREILPLVNDHVKLCYNPFFIAMGTTIRDFLDPEFVLLRDARSRAAEKAKELYPRSTTGPSTRRRSRTPS